MIVDGVDVGLEQIRRGYAWHYIKYAHEQRAVDRERYARAESEARSAHAGLWSFSDPIPPWDYRRAPRGSNPPRSLNSDKNSARRFGSFRKDPRITLLIIFESLSLTPRHCMQK